MCDLPGANEGPFPKCSYSVFASMAPSSTTMHNGSGSASSTMAEAPSTNRGQDGDDVVVQEDSDGWAMEDEDESNAEEASEQFL